MNVKSLTPEQFGSSKGELYAAWLGYLRLTASGMSPAEAFRSLRLSSDVPPRTLDYFAALGIEILTRDYVFAGVADGK